MKSLQSYRYGRCAQSQLRRSGWAKGQCTDDSDGDSHAMHHRRKWQEQKWHQMATRYKVPDVPGTYDIIRYLTLFDIIGQHLANVFICFIKGLAATPMTRGHSPHSSLHSSPLDCVDSGDVYPAVGYSHMCIDEWRSGHGNGQKRCKAVMLRSCLE